MCSCNISFLLLFLLFLNLFIKQVVAESSLLSSLVPILHACHTSAVFAVFSWVLCYTLQVKVVLHSLGL